MTSKQKTPPKLDVLKKKRAVKKSSPLSENLSSSSIQNTENETFSPPKDTTSVKKDASKQESSQKSNFWDTSKTLIFALLVAFALRSFLFEPFNIPSGSMIPNLLVGDFLFVSKWTHGYSRYSFPFGFNIFSGRILEFQKPQSGEVMVFKNPRDTDSQWIKRTVGLPGDTVQMKEGILHINGTPAKLEYVGNYTYFDADDNSTHTAQKFIETFPNGNQHFIIKETPFGEGRLDSTPLYEVPAGHYFMMGDNRDNSGDSRIINNLGFVPAEYILGSADLIYFSTEYAYWPHSTPNHPMNWLSLSDWFAPQFIWWQPWKWFSSIRYDRFFKRIQSSN